MSFFFEDDLNADYDLFNADDCFSSATTVRSSEPSGASQLPMMDDPPYLTNGELASVECGSQPHRNGSKYIIINDVPWCRAIKIPRY